MNGSGVDRLIDLGLKSERQQMNLFTTEHPLNAQPSWFDAKAHPMRAFFRHTLFLTLSLTPVVLVGLYCWLMSPDEGVTTPEPLSAAELWRFLWVGGAFALGFSLMTSLLTVAICRFATRQGRRRAATSSCQE